LFLWKKKSINSAMHVCVDHPCTFFCTPPTHRHTGMGQAASTPHTAVPDIGTCASHAKPGVQAVHDDPAIGPDAPSTSKNPRSDSFTLSVTMEASGYKVQLFIPFEHSGKDVDEQERISGNILAVVASLRAFCSPGFPISGGDAARDAPVRPPAIRRISIFATKTGTHAGETIFHNRGCESLARAAMTDVLGPEVRGEHGDSIEDRVKTSLAVVDVDLTEIDSSIHNEIIWTLRLIAERLNIDCGVKNFNPPNLGQVEHLVA
jgi:hypothetical protein